MKKNVLLLCSIVLLTNIIFCSNKGESEVDKISQGLYISEYSYTAPVLYQWKDIWKSSPYNLFDGDLKTVFIQEHRDDIKLVNDEYSFRIKFNKMIKADKFVFFAGNFVSKTLFNMYSIPKVIEFDLFKKGRSLGRTYIDFKKNRTPVTDSGILVEFDELKITVLEVYPGKKYKDICFTEIKLFNGDSEIKLTEEGKKKSKEAYVKQIDSNLNTLFSKKTWELQDENIYDNYITGKPLKENGSFEVNTDLSKLSLNGIWNYKVENNQLYFSRPKDNGKWTLVKYVSNSDLSYFKILDMGSSNYPELNNSTYKLRLKESDEDIVENINFDENRNNPEDVFIKRYNYSCPILEQWKNIWLYSPVNIFDGDLGTAFVEGFRDSLNSPKTHYTIGYQFNEKIQANKFVFYPGFFKSKAHFIKNSSVRVLKITYLNDEKVVGVKTFEFDKVMESQEKEFDMVEFDELQIEVLRIYPGTKYSDLCISEIKMFKNDNEIKLNDAALKKSREIYAKQIDDNLDYVFIKRAFALLDENNPDNHIYAQTYYDKKSNEAYFSFMTDFPPLAEDYSWNYKRMDHKLYFKRPKDGDKWNLIKYEASSNLRYFYILNMFSDNYPEFNGLIFKLIVTSKD